MKKPTITPLMQQYVAIKEAYPGMILLFQVGDFYELFFEDAVQAAPVLGVALTTRGEMNGTPIPLCGIPLHVGHHYIPKLVQGGYKVALCEQLEAPVPGKVVKRGVTRVITPGMITDEGLLDARRQTLIAACAVVGSGVQIALYEPLTGTLELVLLPDRQLKTLETELYSSMPQELLVTAAAYALMQPVLASCGTVATIVKEPTIGRMAARVCELEMVPSSLPAVDMVGEYLEHFMPVALDALSVVRVRDAASLLRLDAATQRNLDMLVNSADGSSRYTLVSVVDQCMTAMGSRLLRRWLVRPLAQLDRIQERHHAVGAALVQVRYTERLRELLALCGDVERSVGRMSLGRASLTDYVLVRRALRELPTLHQLLSGLSDASLYRQIQLMCQPLPGLLERVEKVLEEEPTPTRMIKVGACAALDQVRLLVDDVQTALLAFERAEQDSTGITTLKVRPQTVHGYTLEVTASYKHLVPPHYIPVQTLTGRERYTTAALRELEGRIVSASDEVASLERKAYAELQAFVLEHIAQLKKLSVALSQLDVLLSFAYQAYRRGYVCPTMTTDGSFMIESGKHPVVSSIVGPDFVPNDTRMDESLMTYIITGPNMGGKSTYLRQVSTIAILAHVGSFVPARSARIPLLDAVYSRVGAGDRLAEGKSTFLVEMEETAIICRQATQKSLVILDEVGRGTSTRDGLALAQAIIEYLHGSLRPYMLFATHYHELTALQSVAGIGCYTMATCKQGDRVQLLHTLIPGVAGESFGLEVAELAQVPSAVLHRARQLLAQPLQQAMVQPAAVVKQPSAVEELLSTVNPDDLTPRQAHELMSRLRDMVQL
jgi:DNA mismatch repair protein MutS